MTKKIIDQLVTLSYSGNFLDQEKVIEIVSHLKRKQLKLYLKALKNREKAISVTIILPSLPTDKEQESFKKLFPNKKIVYNLDPNLLVGVKIVVNDDVYDLNLKHVLESIAFHVQSNV